MGSGKSTLGSYLSAQLDCLFIDSDEVIERIEGKSVSEIVQQHSWDYFRQKESDWLSSVSAENSFVCAVGGGLPCYNSNLEIMLKIGTVIYLECSPSVLYTRLSEQKYIRPLISDLPSEELLPTIINLLDQRKIFYQKSHHVINAELSIQDQSNQIISVLRKN